MKTMEHVEPEEMMAWVDGELAPDAAEVVAAHVEVCGECAGVAAGFQRLSEELAEWRVEEAPARVETAVMGRPGVMGKGNPMVDAKKHASNMGHPTLRRWVLGMGLGSALAAVALLVMVPAWYRDHQPMASYQMADKKTLDEVARRAPGQSDRSDGPMPDAPPSAMASLSASSVVNKDEAATERRMRPEVEQAKAQLEMQQAARAVQQMPNAVASPAAPMIARSVSLTVRVEDVDASRAAVEALLARHHGYAAQMNASTAEDAARTFTASLRIPAAELAAALKELRGLGKVENESQSGEEVTQQHQDLVARLKNARETEARLQAILQQRTGRISDVLEVEQEIARVRGEIESMEAEQAGLEHRVDFASVDLSLAEEYKAEFRAPDPVGTRLWNALAAGYGHARDTVLGMVLFAEEFGPALMVWGILLGLPAAWVWRRYRRARRVG